MRSAVVASRGSVDDFDCRTNFTLVRRCRSAASKWARGPHGRPGTMLNATTAVGSRSGVYQNQLCETRASAVTIKWCNGVCLHTFQIGFWSGQRQHLRRRCMESRRGDANAAAWMHSLQWWAEETSRQHISSPGLASTPSVGRCSPPSLPTPITCPWPGPRGTLSILCECVNYMYVNYKFLYHTESIQIYSRYLGIFRIWQKLPRLLTCMREVCTECLEKLINTP